MGRRLLQTFGALAVVALVVGFVVWQGRDEQPPPSVAPGDVVLQYADGSELVRIPPENTPAPKSAAGWLRAQVMAELELHTQVTFAQATAASAIIRTTIDPKLQLAAASAGAEAMRGLPNLRHSVTAIDPASGSIRAYWPGDDVDYARGVLRTPGSAFTPIVLAAALRSGKALDTTFDCRSPRTIGAVQIRNQEPVAPRCTLREAAERSVNTAMYDLVANDLGGPKVADLAKRIGIPETVEIDGWITKLLAGKDAAGPDATIALGVGDAQLRPFDLAAAYSTFAADGVRHRPHFIADVRDRSGTVLYQAVDDAKPAISKEIAGQVTDLLKSIPACAAKAACKPGEAGHPVSAGDYSDAWMIGYTPALAVSVWVGTDKGSTLLRDANNEPVTGTGLPATIWKTFLAKA
ncbi:hypothetical protein Lesp02_65240 [Lentzea sp. NBRC 105346]|uniref:penicillin-binding transpeptidase domain-containing protein n=1 Tax=Lentzea sp. NBRC 105346 TaxID=3032205 RepID=UPI0024A48C71|nr:penicillin-binding transpeptidase domain-containing protein [Lentzea sp. NBRC 105346]GLZ34337.1 hypothetical protein Lesp02_65240 [Lentzea sp. NBRC 105346]